MDTLQITNTFHRTVEFDAWLSSLKNKIGKARIIKRIRTAEAGNFGDCAPVGEGVSEMRIHVGAGYRVYYERRMSFNSRRAQEAAKWAEAHGKADAFHNAVFRAYFVDGKNLFEIKTLAAAADSVGLNGADLEKVLRAQDYRTAVDQ
jgi:putative addiction module killer protein